MLYEDINAKILFLTFIKHLKAWFYDSFISSLFVRLIYIKDPFEDKSNYWSQYLAKTESD